MKHRGFTVVELLVVIVIMAVILTLVAVNVRSTQIKARDNERATDVANIVTALESYREANHGGSSESYPATSLVNFTINNYGAMYIKERVDDASLKAPGANNVSFVLATNNATTPTSVTPLPTTSTYVYQPLARDNSLCSASTTTCAKFNLYYVREEATADCPAPSNICTVRSTFQ